MLKTEEIAKRLAAAKKIKPWTEDRLDRLRDLDAPLRSVGHVLLGRDEAGKGLSEEERPWATFTRAGEKLAKLGEAEMLALGDRLLPQFTDAFRAAWDLQARLPVQTGYARKPFRAPHRPDLLLESRRNFLASILSVMQGYNEDLPWLAAHAAHLSHYVSADRIGTLLAAGIELGGKRGEEVEQILRDSAAGLHEVGQFGRHVVTGLLVPNKPDCWAFMQKMLLAAQRQEGLRQAILEAVDFSHPDAFRSMLRTIDENNLARFSATVRAADVWLGLQWDSSSVRHVEQTLHSVSQLLDDESARERALSGMDPEQAYFALWATAFDDLTAAIAPAKKLLSHENPEARYVALRILAILGLNELFDIVLPMVDDPDPRIANYAAKIETGLLNQRVISIKQDEEKAEVGIVGHVVIGRYRAPTRLPAKDSGDLFERMEKLHVRLPEKTKPSKPLVWPWVSAKVVRAEIADSLVPALGERPAGRLLPYLSEMAVPSRTWTAALLGRTKPMDATTRQAMLNLVGDAAGGVRDAAVAAIRKTKISPDDIGSLEPLLTRKASDLRRSVLSLILSLDDANALASAERLVASNTLPQRLAALDLLTQMHEAGRAVKPIEAIANQFKSSRSALDRDEEVYLEKLLGGEQERITLDNALGLNNPTKRTPPTPPKPRGTKLCTAATVALLKSLDDLIHEHRERTVTVRRHGGDAEPQLLGSLRWGLPYPRQFKLGKPEGLSPKDELPLNELWFGWWNDRPAAERDRDGFEGLRASFAVLMMRESSYAKPPAWGTEALKPLFEVALPKLRYSQLMHSILTWLNEYHRPANLADFAIDSFESMLAVIPPDKLAAKGEHGGVLFREFINSCSDLTRAAILAREDKQWTAEHIRRMYGLLRWVDEPGVAVVRSRPNWDTETLPAYDAGVANEHDLLDDLVGTRGDGYGSRHFSSLATTGSMLRRGELSPKMAALMQRVIDRILEIELRRGETETAATDPALSLTYAGHTDVLISVLQAIGRDPKLQRSYAWGEASKGKSPVFSHLIRVTFPHKDETPEQFVAAVKAAKIDEDALLAVAFYAPQWARFIEAAIGWPMFEEAVWWFHAHTKDAMWRVDRDIRESWNASIRKLTPLTLEDLMEGAVDVDWFHRVHEMLGSKKWDRLSEFAKYASGGAGHTRAMLFAQAMLGKANRKQLADVIVKKRKQDAVRAIGLVPIDKKTRKKDVLERYRVLQEFVRTSRQFGSMRQASEKLSARIGQENLARTAGYPDPIRLQWAMEGLATADLAKGPVTIKVKDVEVSLSIEADGLPEISVARAGKPLKSIPPEVKKNEKVKELTERKTDLRRSASRMRQSLEQAMCRGDRFSRDELAELMQNVVLCPMLERLVFVGEKVAGYPVEAGAALRDQAGKVSTLKDDDQMRLAHPVDLLKGKQWTAWQRDCFAAERVQPFKQVFRELYVLTEQEKSDATFSRRYAGQQVNPRQALALLGGRGWVAAPEAGVFRMFPDEKLVAWIEFMETFYTPADIEGLTLEKVRFAKRGSIEHVNLKDVPPRVLSESMRDVDLIVSVAHRGNVDPEASASTVELRSALLRETLQLLKMKNVTIQGAHAKVKGTLADYSVHLGSATTHMLPGGTLFIVPVHSQHRGRIFLPFADEDPKTAEIISKVLLLARDEELKDPSVLVQIQSRT